MHRIFELNMPASSWALLWWLILEMDDHGEVHGGWRVRAARDMGKDRIWVGRCAMHLQRNGLIDTLPRQQSARVCVENIK